MLTPARVEVIGGGVGHVASSVIGHDGDIIAYLVLLRPAFQRSEGLTDRYVSVEKNNGEVTSFITDGQGRFRVSLPPGHYKVSLQGRKTTIGRFGPFEADVAPGKMTNVQWECDTEIR